MSHHAKKEHEKSAIFMELCEQSLNEYMYRNDLRSQDLKHVMVGVLKGLEHLHSQDILHRDLKPQNILLKSGIIGGTSIQDKIIKIRQVTTLGKCFYFKQVSMLNSFILILVIRSKNN